MKTFIYTLSDPTTNQIRYIGKTNNINRRFAKHVAQAKKSTQAYRNAWIRSILNTNKLPIIEIIDEIEGEWEWLEKYWISQFKEWGFNLVNVMPGGDGVDYGTIPWNKGTEGIMRPNLTSFKKGSKIGKETRFIKGSRIGEKTRFKKGLIPHNKGIPCSEETKNKIRNANKGHIKSEETRKKLSNARKGFKVSEETMIKLRVPVLQYNLNGDLLNEFKSLTEASKFIGVSQETISRWAKGKFKCKKYIWKLKDLS